MGKKLLLLLNLLLLATVIKAAPVSKTEAQKKALQFISGKLAAARGTSVNTPNLQLEATGGDNYYVFNVVQQQGFVIVSGDDRAPEILGYSDEGPFDANNIPDNMKVWLEGYALAIQELKNIPDIAEARGAVRTPKNKWAAIDPLIKTKWDQGKPYNGKLPKFIDKSDCVTGCVATAMAQVLYYVASQNDFTFPVGTIKAIPGYECSTNWGSYGIVRVPEVPITNFKWNEMKFVYSNAEVDDAVAELMLSCGASVNMDYRNQNNGGSSASASNVPYAFKTYFGFDDGIKYIQRDNYSIDEWENIIYEEIANERPVLYGGQKSSGSGHEFICDGYDGNGLFHFNWGWGGSSNGFFVLWAANSNGGGIGAGNGSGGYSMDQDAVIGIQAPTGEPIAEEEKLMTVKKLLVKDNILTYNRSDKSKNFTVPICAVVENATNSTFSPSFGFGLYGDGTNSVLSYSNGVSCNPGSFYNYNPSTNQYYYTDVTFGANKTGTFQIVPISKERSSSTWLKDGMSDQYYIEATMTDKQLTLRVMPIVNLTVTDVEFPGVKMAEIAQKVKVTVMNNGSEYNGEMYLRVNNEIVTGEGVALRAGEETDVYFYYVPSSGTNSYAVLSSDGSSLKTGTVEMAAFSATDRINLEKKLVANNKTDGQYIFGDYMDLTLVAKNNSNQVYRGWLKLSTEDGTFDPSSPTVIAPGDSVELNYVIGMTIGNTYMVYSYQIYNNGNYYYRDYLSSSITYTATEGVELLLADGTSDMVVAPDTFEPTPFITAVDLRGLTTVTAVNADGADNNCLFLIDEDATIDGLPQTNVIRGTTADNVVLSDDGIGFTAPINFTATEISYERIFPQGTDGTGSGWTTIVLPFDVEKVMVGDTEIDWFHSRTDTGKNFWLRELKSDAEGSVTFGYVEELKANTPYIIAVPGDKWGDEWNLTNKTLKFIGTNVTIIKNAEAETNGNHYSFIGTTIRQQFDNVYALNEAGSSFKLGEADIAPFRAYFTPLADSNASRLVIRSADGQTTAITMPEKEPIVTGDIYTLDGRKVKGNLPKGVYIMNGKKMIK